MWSKPTGHTHMAGLVIIGVIVLAVIGASVVIFKRFN